LRRAKARLNLKVIVPSIEGLEEDFMKRQRVRLCPPVVQKTLFGVLALSATLPVGAQDAPTAPATTPANPPTATTPAKDDADVKAQAIAAYNTGLEAVRKSNWDVAATNFEKAVALDSKDTSSWMFLGYVRLKQEKYDAALTALQTAEKLIAPADSAGKATLYNNLGLVYWNKNQPTDAIAAYQKALQFDKKATDAQYNLAFALLAQKRYAEAQPNLEALVKTTTDPALLAALYDALGEAYENQKNWAGALGAYKKAIEQRPNEPSYQLHMALALINSNRKNDAVPFLSKVIELDPQSTDPQSAEAFLQLGAVQIEKRDWPGAQRTLKSYVALRPKDSLGWFNLGVAYDYDGKFNEALDAYGKAREQDDKNPAIRNNVGRIYFKRGKFDEAITELQAALQRDGQSADARHNLAIVYSEQGRQLETQQKPTEAKAKYDAADKEWRLLLASIEPVWAKETDPDRKAQLSALVAGARAGLAENALSQKRYSDAAFEYNRLLQAAPDNQTARLNLGLSLYYDKKLDDAEKVYREIIARDPKNAIAYNNLGAVLEAEGNKAGAIEAYRKALDLNKNYTEASNNLKRLVDTTKVG
jgi:tetratricopeptide (TPR) repeat protein